MTRICNGEKKVSHLLYDTSGWVGLTAQIESWAEFEVKMWAGDLAKIPFSGRDDS